MSPDSYPPPVGKLLTLGDVRHAHEWPDYLELGLGAEHIPELIRMAVDDELHRADSDSLWVWAPIHAWRALAQLRAAAAVGPLLVLLEKLVDEDDYAMAELPEVFGRIGVAALPALEAFLADRAHRLYARIAAATSLARIGDAFPEARTACVAALTSQLEHFGDHDPAFNAFLIDALIDLEAVEAAPVIERAFAADGVDESVVGDWDDVQVGLGLKEPEGVEWFQADSGPFGLAPAFPWQDRRPVAHQRQSERKAKAKAKAKRKLAQAPRRRNRKRE